MICRTGIVAWSKQNYADIDGLRELEVELILGSDEEE
jgi:hypothetical protein